jgi:hypothetical protein
MNQYPITDLNNHGHIGFLEAMRNVVARCFLLSREKNTGVVLFHFDRPTAPSNTSLRIFLPLVLGKTHFFQSSCMANFEKEGIE